MGQARDQNTPSNIWAGTGYGSTEDSAKSSTSPSRLSEQSVQLRTALESRNLYTDFRQYPLQPNTRQKIVNAVGTILNTVTPFKSIDFTDTVISRLINTPTTPLTDIGLIMVGKQFALNFASNLKQETFPSIDVRNAFDGNSETKLFQENKNFRITRIEEKANSFQQFLERFVGWIPYRANPLPDSKNREEGNKLLIENTGTAQLDFLFGPAANASAGGINRNVYKPTTQVYQDAADASENKIADRVNIVANRKWIDFQNQRFYPLLYIGDLVKEDDITSANAAIYSGYTESAKELGTQEYGTSREFLDDYLGDTTKTIFEFGEDVDPESGFADNIENQLVWGRDGVSSRANNRLNYLRGVEITVSEDGSAGSGENTPQDPKAFNIRTGLLEYTRNLLNASEGQYIDQTRKKYVEYTPKKRTAYNGSSLWTPPENSLFAGRTGVRQHSILDQYDRFAKAIRFDGNQVYGGNENSVIYKSVLPRIHPILDQNGQIDNKNLMFSLENLAVVTVGGNVGDNFGIIDDEFGTRIPRCEVGPFGGRTMWFPPYDLNVVEVAKANYDSTVMVGRGEPIYTYMHSERTATVTFKMIVDYPEQARQLFKDGSYKEVAEFFAFGAEGYSRPDIGPDNPGKKENDNDDTGEEIEGPTDVLPPEIIKPQEFTMYFPNDFPNVGSDNASAVDQMYRSWGYEAASGFINGRESKDNALNENIYWLTGLTNNGDGTYDVSFPSPLSQAQAEFVEGRRPLDDELYRLYNDPSNAGRFKINILGTATVLYTPGDDADIEAQRAYNLALSERRAKTAEDFIKERIFKIFGQYPDQLGIDINVEFIGDVGGSPDNDTADSIPTLSAKQERAALISFEDTGVSEPPKKQNLTPEEQQSVETLNNENQTLNSTNNVQKRNAGVDCVMNERTSDEEGINDTGILKGFQSITKNYFYPAFHSQTPEDFHKRLTFLHQCTRQGSAIRSGTETDDFGIKRAKNSVFGRQPICILRIGDFFYTKVVIDNITFEYSDTIWDTNPEGFGMQPTIVDITLQMKVIGGQSLKGPIDALQNAVSFNYYANSTYTDKGGPYETATDAAEKQQTYINGVVANKRKKLFVEGGIGTEKEFNKLYDINSE